MQLDLVLPVTERSVTGVRRVRNVERREVLIREEPRQIPAEGTVGTAKTLMHVSPLPLPFLTVGTFLQKLIPLLMPLVE